MKTLLIVAAAEVFMGLVALVITGLVVLINRSVPARQQTVSPALQAERQINEIHRAARRAMVEHLLQQRGRHDVQ